MNIPDTPDGSSHALWLGREEREESEGKLLMKNRNSSRCDGTTDRKFSREICIADLTCTLLGSRSSLLCPCIMYDAHSKLLELQLCYGFESVADYSTHIPLSNLPRPYLVYYLLTYYQPTFLHPCG